MKPAALFDRLLDLVAAPYMRRQALAIGANHGLLQAARIVGTLAPADAVQTYVHTVMKGEQQLARWRLAYTTGGGIMPMLFWLAGLYLADFHNPWLIVGAQLVWITLWTFVGTPWLFCTLDEHQLELRAGALSVMCGATDATQAQLNAASARLDLGQWHAHNPHDDDPHP